MRASAHTRSRTAAATALAASLAASWRAARRGEVRLPGEGVLVLAGEVGVRGDL